MKKTGISIFLILFLSGILSADTLTLSFFQNVTDNLFQSNVAEPDHLSNLSFSVDKNFSPFSVFAFGNFSYLFENSDITYYTQDLGLDYLHPLADKTALYFSLTGRGNFYQSDYSDYNYLSLNFFMALKSYLSQTSILKSNYAFEFKNYKTSLYDFLSHSFLLSIDKYFQTRTTVKAEMNWGYKYFLHPYQSADLTTVVEVPFLHGGMGKGKHPGGSYSLLYAPTASTQDGGEGIQVLSLATLIAQGLGNKVGLNITGMRQWVLSGENPFVFIQEFYMVENPSYDRFSWEGFQLGSQLTFLGPGNIELKMGYTYSNKEFPGIESLSLDGDPLGVTRKDQRKRVELSVEKDFSSFSLYLSYSFINNHSNDPYFDWKGNFFSVGVSWNHFFGGGK